MPKSYSNYALLFIAIFLIQYPFINTFYVPGVAPVEFVKGAVVDVKVNFQFFYSNIMCLLFIYKIYSIYILLIL